MITIGVDFHKRTSSYKFLDEHGNSIKRCKLVNDPVLIRELLTSVHGPKQLAMEATRSWGLFHECVKDHVDQFHLGHPKKMKAITESETKNDKTDADMIARLTHSGFLPKAHVSSLNTRQLRSLVRFRGHLVNQRRAIRNQIQTLLDRNVWLSQRPQSFKSPLCKRGRLWLEQLQLPERERFILDQCLDNLDHLNNKISNMELYIQKQEHDMPGLTHLRTVPGFRISVVSVYCVLAEISDINRFRNAKGFAHYAGLIPREYSSGDKHRTGRLIKGANLCLRTTIIESTLAAIRSDKGLRAYYLKVKARSGSGDAIVATARKLSYAIYHVLKEQRSYRPELEQPSAAACHPFSVSRKICAK